MRPILEKFRYQFENFKELVNQGGLKSALHESVYFNREMVLAERDLTKPLPKLKKDFDITLILIGRGSSTQIDELKFPNKVRELKGRAYSRRGFSAFFAVVGSKVIAEQWWISSSHIRDKILHPDLRWMQLQLKEDEIYAFDLFVAPEYRGTPATNKFAVTYLNEMRKAGFSKLFGGYFKNNIPSAWYHRTLLFSEKGKMKRHRFFFLEIKNGKLCFA
jgi:hypothetical protein